MKTLILLVWGEGIGDGLVGGGLRRKGGSSNSLEDAFSPKILVSVFGLDTKKIYCGSKHAVLINRQGEIYSWGEGSGGKLGHRVDAQSIIHQCS